MKVSIKIEFASPKDAHAALALIAGLDYTPTAVETEPAKVVMEEKTEEPMAEAPKKAGGRPKKKAEPEAKIAEPEAKTPEEIVQEIDAEEKSVISAAVIRKEMAEEKLEAAVTSYTLDQARSALKTFAIQNGTDKALDVLRLFGASKISELPADKYGAFIEKLQ